MSTTRNTAEKSTLEKQIDKLIETNTKQQAEIEQLTKLTTNQQTLIESLDKKLKSHTTKIGKIETGFTTKLLLEETVNDLKVSLHNIELKFEELQKETKTNITKIETNIPKAAPTYASFFKDEASKATLLTSLNNETKQQDLKKSNIVLTGVPLPAANNPNTDSNIFQELATDLECDLTNIQFSTKRVGKINEQNCQKIIIKITPEKRAELVRKSKQLRDLDKWNNVYLNPDLTKAQQEAQYLLRCELRNKIAAEPNKRWVISRNRIVEYKDRITRPNTPAATTNGNAEQ